MAKMLIEKGRILFRRKAPLWTFLYLFWEYLLNFHSYHPKKNYPSTYRMPSLNPICVVLAWTWARWTWGAITLFMKPVIAHRKENIFGNLDLTLYGPGADKNAMSRVGQQAVISGYIIKYWISGINPIWFRRGCERVEPGGLHPAHGTGHSPQAWGRPSAGQARSRPAHHGRTCYSRRGLIKLL